MCIFEMFIVKQLQQFEKRLILIKIIYKNKDPALRAPYRDQSVSLSVCLSVRDILSGTYRLSPWPKVVQISLTECLQLKDVQ